MNRINAELAQLVEQLICNQQVVGSSPTFSSKKTKFLKPFHFKVIERDYNAALNILDEGLRILSA